MVWVYPLILLLVPAYGWASKPSPTLVVIGCSIHLQTADHKSLISSPKVGTTTGRVAQVTLTQSDKEGKPHVDLLVELTPELVEGHINIGGTASIRLAGGPAKSFPVAQGDEASVTLPVDADKSYLVSCRPLPPPP
jgi:hypothetical protein